MIEVNNLSTKFGENLVHDDISFSIKQGEIFGILGGSGSGKTTLLRQMIMLDEIQSGEIKILNHNIKTANDEEKDFIKKNWGVLFQFSALFSSLSSIENVAFQLKENTSLPQDLINDIALTKLCMVGLDPHSASLYPEELSGGMKKRVALARSLSLDPKILFLDEPTSGLDPSSARAFDELILNLRDMLGLTVVIVTHDIDTIKNVLDRFLVLHEHKILVSGSYQEVISTNNDIIKKFIKINKGRINGE